MKKAWYIILFILIVLGLIEALHVLRVGQIATGASDKMPWGLDVPVYIFLTGMSAGSFIISSLALFGLKQFESISRIAVVQAVVLLLIAPVVLLIAMGHPGRFWMIYLYPNPTSVISWGAYLLLLYPICCCLYGYYMMKRDMVKTPLSAIQIQKHDKLARFFGILGVPLAIMVHGYTGVLLGFIRGRPLWHTPLMPVLFLTSAVVSGIALLLIILVVLNKYTSIKTDKEVLYSLSKIMLMTLLLDIFFMGAEVLTGLYGRSGEVYEAWMVLISGRYAFHFIVLELILGAFVPIVLLATGMKNIRNIVLASIAILIGVFAMRYNIIIGGQVIQTYGGPHGEYVPRIGEWLVVLGLWSVGALMYSFAVKYLPLRPKSY